MRTFLDLAHMIEFPRSPKEQVTELDSIVSTLVETNQRKPLVYADFHHNRNYGRKFPLINVQLSLSRAEVFESLKNNPLIFWSPGRLVRTESWREKSNYAFEISVFGNGLDCYRTWEALILGMIVIVQRGSGLDKLYQG